MCDLVSLVSLVKRKISCQTEYFLSKKGTLSALKYFGLLFLLYFSRNLLSANYLAVKNSGPWLIHNSASPVEIKIFNNKERKIKDLPFRIRRTIIVHMLGMNKTVGVANMWAYWIWFVRPKKWHWNYWIYMLPISQWYDCLSVLKQIPMFSILWLVLTVELKKENPALIRQGLPWIRLSLALG